MCLDDYLSRRDRTQLSPLEWRLKPRELSCHTSPGIRTNLFHCPWLGLTGARALSFKELTVNYLAKGETRKFLIPGRMKSPSGAR